MTERFSTSTTSYLDRTDGKNRPERVQVDPRAAVDRERAAAKIETERAATNTATQVAQQQPVAEDPNAPILVDVVQKADDSPEQMEGILDDEALPKAIDSELVSSNEQPVGNGTISRSDSDADIKAATKTTTSQTALAKPEKPKAGFTKTRTKEPVIKKRAETVRALDLAYAPPAGSGCTFPDNNVVRVGVQYRQTSYAIKGQSLTNIDQLIRLYQKCGGGKMLVLQNNEGLRETEERLIQLRKDEVKYYLLQRRVPKDDMIFSDNS